METLDPAAEWLRLSERYRQMSDDELIALTGQPSELTDIAQQVLAQEISQRNLKPEEQSTRQKPLPAPDSSDLANDPYAQDRELVEIGKVWSSSDALQLQNLLDTAGIPFYMGSEKANGVDAVTSNFTNGVSVRVMRIGVPWARQALQHYSPANEPPAVKDEGGSDLEVRCPKCRSTEVVFENLVDEATTAADNCSQKYKWTCDSCGHEWEDEGIVTE